MRNVISIKASEENLPKINEKIPLESWLMGFVLEETRKFREVGEDTEMYLLIDEDGEVFYMLESDMRYRYAYVNEEVEGEFSEMRRWPSEPSKGS